MKTYCKHCGVVITQIRGRWGHGPDPLGNYYILCKAQVAEPLEAVTSPGVPDPLRESHAELLEALKQLEALWDFSEPILPRAAITYDDPSAINRAMEQARAAIAKAEKVSQ